MERSRTRSSTNFVNSRPCDLTSSYPLLLKYFLYITTLATAPCLSPKCLPIVGFTVPISSITLPLTLYWTAKELYIRPITLAELILFILFLLTTFLTLYIGEKKRTVPLTAFSGPSIAYKPNYSRRCLCRCLCRCLRRYLFFYFPPPYTAHINLATTCYSPPYYGPVEYWAYYYGPLYCGTTRL